MPCGANTNVFTVCHRQAPGEAGMRMILILMMVIRQTAQPRVHLVRAQSWVSWLHNLSLGSVNTHDAPGAVGRLTTCSALRPQQLLESMTARRESEQQSARAAGSATGSRKRAMTTQKSNINRSQKQVWPPLPAYRVPEWCLCAPPACDAERMTCVLSTVFVRWTQQFQSAVFDLRVSEVRMRRARLY